MNPLSVNAIGPVTLSALSALRPVQAVAVPAPSGNTADATTLSTQDLAQSLFQRTLQAATAFPVAEPAAGSLGLIQDVTASLLASLSAPQAAATTTPALDATTNPAAVPAAPAAAADTTATTPTATVVADVTTPPDAFATSSSQDFALQTALRFGAGVSAQATPAPAAMDLSTGLVRDAVAVPRLENLQPHAGGPGPEAFTQPQAAPQRVLRGYQAVPAAEGSVGLDLMA